MEMQSPVAFKAVWFVILGLGIVAVIAIAIVTIVALAMGKARFGWVLGVVACLAVPALLATLFVGVYFVRSRPVGETLVVSTVDTDGRLLTPTVDTASATVSTSQPASSTEPRPPATEQPITIDKLPEWVSQPEATREGVTTLVLSSQRFVTQEEAEQQLAGEVARRLRQYFHEEHPSQGLWELPADYDVRRTVKQRHVELIPKNFGDSIDVNMHRVHWQLELSPDVRRELYPLWREQTVKQRLTQYGAGVGGLAFLLLVTSTYFRVDASTKGAYRGWLRLAAISVVAAGGATACLIS